MKYFFIVLISSTLLLTSCNKEKQNDLDFSWVTFLFSRGLNLPISDKTGNSFFQQNVALGIDKGLIYREYENNSIQHTDYAIFNFTDLKLDQNGFNHLHIFNNDYIIILGKRNIVLYNLTDSKYSNVDPSIKVIDIPGIKIPKQDLHDLSISEEGIDIISSSYLVENSISYDKHDTYYYWSDNDSYTNYINQTNFLAIRKNGGMNEYIVLKLDKEDYLHKYSDNKIYLLNGYVDLNRMELYKKNNRIKSADIYNNSTGEFITKLTFKDIVEFTEISIPLNCNQIKIVITDVYQGSKYPDLCLTAAVYGQYNWLANLSQEIRNFDKAK